MALAVDLALTVPRDHPAFEGHFPGRPILPGVCLLAEAMASLEAATATGARDWRVESAKFTSPVEPGAALAIAHRGDEAGRVRFEIRAGDRLVASGVLARRAPGQP
jgi:3-hydroxymyristoyl/3-hydroxydecanoyl-(acyl carrier protein) dehydratase